jgi:ABC-type multidrug transport system fused ATPase/permease subunit
VEPRPVSLDGDPPPLPPISRDARDRLHSLRVRGLTYRYPETGQGIFDANLTLERGSFTVITGRVGSGKTTLLRTILGLLPKQDGDIFWNDVRVEQPGAFFRPPISAYTPQVPHLFSETLRANILAGLDEQEAPLTAAIWRAACVVRSSELPSGMFKIT